MKKIILSIVGSMVISLCTVQGQQSDTAGAASRQSDQQWQQDQSQNRDAYANEGMVMIDKDELPASLKETLQDGKYAGWENATIYHNTNTGEYVITPRAYRFDKEGKEIEMDNSMGYGNRPGGAQQDAQSQAREQMGEIPTSAPETSDQNQQSQTGDPQQPSSSYRTDPTDKTNVSIKMQKDEATQEQFRKEGMVEYRQNKYLHRCEEP